MKNVAPVRREMGVRTIFNILGPLTNPAGAPNTLLGVFHPDLVGILVRVMQRARRRTRAGGLRPGRHGRNLARRRHPGRRTEGRRNPRVRNPPRGLRPADGVEPQPARRQRAPNRRRWCWTALANTPGTAREIVVLNAGAALYAANVADSIADGIALAREAIASGAARAKLDEFVAYTRKGS